MSAWYNETDPFAAEWLRALILFGHIAEGDVDERSIEDVTPNDLQGYTQCHFFAGIGIWSLALRQAGWSDDRPAWTGSCPCQPFSAAGKGAGFADERHLWPAWHWLIGQCRPDVLFGEQVEGPAGDRWFDLVSSDLEGEGYACGQSVFPAAGVGAPHIRHRRYWLAHGQSDGRIEWRAEPDRRGLERGQRLGDDDAGFQVRPLAPDQRRTVRDEGSASGAAGTICDGLEHADDQRQGTTGDTARAGDPSRAVRTSSLVEPAGQQEGFPGCTRVTGGAGGMVEPPGARRQGWLSEPPTEARRASGRPQEPGRRDIPWSDPDWIWCRDSKYRPVEPGTFPLAHGYPGRVGALRGYGNALCAEQATVFIEEAMKCL